MIGGLLLILLLGPSLIVADGQVGLLSLFCAHPFGLLLGFLRLIRVEVPSRLRFRGSGRFMMNACSICLVRMLSIWMSLLLLVTFHVPGWFGLVLLRRLPTPSGPHPSGGGHRGLHFFWVWPPTFLIFIMLLICSFVHFQLFLFLVIFDFFFLKISLFFVVFFFYNFFFIFRFFKLERRRGGGKPKPQTSFQFGEGVTTSPNKFLVWGRR